MKVNDMLRKRCQVCFETLSITSRFKIFKYLADSKKKVNINSLVGLTHLRQPTVTFHVNMLQKAGILQKEKIGREVYCHVRQPCNKPNCPLFV